MSTERVQEIIESTLDMSVPTKPRRVLRDIDKSGQALATAMAACAALPDERARSAYLLLLQASSAVSLAEAIVSRYEARRATIPGTRSSRRKTIDPGASQPPL